jgi:integron integrase
MGAEQLTGFEDYIVRNELVPGKYARYHRLWAERWLAFAGPDAEQEADAARRRYLEVLAHDGRTADWQVRQADDAVKLYLWNYLPTVRGAQGSAAVAGPTAAPANPGQALDAMRDELRLRHYAYRTEQTYLEWAGRFLAYTSRRAHEQSTEGDISSGMVKDFLTHLALERNVSASTQNQAFSALLFLCRQVLHLDLQGMEQTLRARRGRRLPTVLSPEEVAAVLRHAWGLAGLMLRLIYGTGLRIHECLQLRVKDIDFAAGLVWVRGKGDKDRTTLLPKALDPELRQQIEAVRRLHSADLAAGLGDAWLPDALAVKYRNAGRELGWQYLFPADSLAADPRGGTLRRHHVNERVLQRAMHDARRAAGILKPASVHTLRHCFATHLLLAGTDIRQIQELLGHNSLETTMVYTHVVRELKTPAASPLDLLAGGAAAGDAGVRAPGAEGQRRE